MGVLSQNNIRRFIIERLKASNSFRFLSTDHSNNVVRRNDGSLVAEFKVAGNMANAYKDADAAAYPLPMGKRNKTPGDYTLSRFDLPFLIDIADLDDLTINELQSITNDGLTDLEDIIGDDIIFQWANDNNILLTSGAGVDIGHPVMTGLRKAVTWDDMMAAQNWFNAMDAPMENRQMLASSNIVRDLMNIPGIVTGYASIQNLSDAVAKIFGFNLTMRSRTILLDSDGEKKSYKTTETVSNSGGTLSKVVSNEIAANDRDCALFWHPNFVSRAEGNLKNSGINVIENPNRADYAGSSLVDMQIHYGGKLLRDNGSLLLVQDIA